MVETNNQDKMDQPNRKTKMMPADISNRFNCKADFLRYFAE